MSEERCSLCNKPFSLIGEDGCDECGLEYDPLEPARTVPLDFSRDPVTEYQENYGEDPLTPLWDGEDED